MPKMKTHMEIAKRFKLSANVLMRSKGMKSHLRRKKSKRTKDFWQAKYCLMKQLAKEYKIN